MSKFTKLCDEFESILAMDSEFRQRWLRLREAGEAQLESKGLVWVFPHHDVTPELREIFKNRKPDDGTFIGFCDSLIVIDLDKCVMYVANPDDPKILKLKEIEV